MYGIVEGRCHTCTRTFWFCLSSISITNNLNILLYVCVCVCLCVSLSCFCGVYNGFITLPLAPLAPLVPLVPLAPLVPLVICPVHLVPLVPLLLQDLLYYNTITIFLSQLGGEVGHLPDPALENQKRHHGKERQIVQSIVGIRNTVSETAGVGSI